jgi:hypothetical protein
MLRFGEAGFDPNVSRMTPGYLAASAGACGADTVIKPSCVQGYGYLGLDDRTIDVADP